MGRKFFILFSAVAVWASTQAFAVCDVGALKTLAFEDQLLEWNRVVALSKAVQTRAFETMTYAPPVAHPMPGFPDVAVDAKAVVLAFTGAGTYKTTGQNYIRDGIALAKYGVSLVSMDYPYHGQGPTQARFRDPAEFKKMLFAFVKHYKKTGLPVYALGHSFGVTVIQEILHDAPDLLAGAVLLSPGGNVTPRLLRHYRRLVRDGVMARYTTEQGVVWNRPGEFWSEGLDGSGGVAGEFVTTRDLSPIRTQTPVVVIAGDRDHWNTPVALEEIASRFPNGHAEVLAGESHHTVFTKELAPSGDENEVRERWLIERVVAFISESSQLLIDRRSNAQALPAPARLKYYYQTSLLFRSWWDRKRIPLAVQEGGEAAAKSVLAAWVEDLRIAVWSHCVERLKAIDAARYSHLPLAAKVRPSLLKPLDQVNGADLDVMAAFLDGTREFAAK